MSLIGARLTPDALPYEGYGVASKGEYAATLAFLRAVRDGDSRAVEHALQTASVSSNEYRGAMAALRGGLVRQSGHDRTGTHRLTAYGLEYLRQRSTP